MEEDREYQSALKHVRAIRSFFVHLAVYLIVNTGLFAIDAINRDDGWWFYWPLIGWGIGVAAHGVSVFMEEGLFGPDWEDRKVRDLLDKKHGVH